MTPPEKYLEHLDNIFMKEPEFYENESLIDGVKKVVSIVYRDIPEAGYITAVTYGLSHVDFPEWKFGRPELCISVQSEHLDWGIISGFLANRFRGKIPFCYGEVINFGERISPDSDMDAFLIFAPSILQKEDYSNIETGTGYKINIAGLIPIYSDEIEIYNKIGLKELLFHPDFDLYNVKRKKITM